MTTLAKSGGSAGKIASGLVKTLVTYLGLRVLLSWVGSTRGWFVALATQVGLGGDVAKGVGALGVSLLTIGLILLYVYATGRRNKELGLNLRGAAARYAKGAGVSVAMIGLIVLLSWACGGVRFVGFGWGSVGVVEFVSLMLLSMLNVREELLYRGWMIADMKSYLPVGVAVVVSAVLFGVAHRHNHYVTPLALLNLVLLGLFWGLCYVRTGSLWLVMAMHSFWNFAQSRIVGLPVSGFDSQGALVMFEGVERGLFATDNFGLEGNLATTLVIVVAMVVVLAKREIRKEQKKER